MHRRSRTRAPNAVEKIRAHLESKGHKTIGGFISYNGLVNVTLADTHSVDTILASSYYIFPFLSKEGVHVSPPRYIPINFPFELCIGGLSDYEGLHDTIEKWLYHQYTHEDEEKSTRVVDTRLSDDHDHFIFAMDSWESTMIVLKDSDNFKTYFTHSPLLTSPKLVFGLNSDGFGRKSIASTLDAGAGLINDAITDLRRDLTEFRKEQTENNSLVQRQVAAVHANMENQTRALTQMGNQQHQFGLSLLAGRDEKAIESKLSSIDNNILFEMQCLRATDDPDEKAVIKGSIAKLQTERREQATLLADASAYTIRLMAPAPGTVVHEITSSTTVVPQPPLPTAVETAAVRTNPSTPIHSRVTSAAPSAENIITPATTAQSPPAAPLAPFTPSRTTFDFSTTSTPTPAPRWNTNSKSDKIANLLQTSAKNLKPHTTTRSTTRSMQPTSTAGGTTLDVFGEGTNSTVRPHTNSFSPHLFTALAGQGQCTHGLGPVVAGASHVTRLVKKPVLRDQKGRVYTQNATSYHACLKSSPKCLPPLLFWALVAIIILSFCVTVEAAPSASGSLSMFALNTNGFVHPMKIDATNRVIAHRNPDIVVITETKTNSSRSSKMAYNDYQFFEERGIPVSGHHLYKWGLILGIKKGISISQRVNVTHPALIGRLIAVDIVIPLDTGDGFVHRVIAAYAPWDITDTAETAAYWIEATKICATSPHSWTLLGDLNATVSPNERKSGGFDSRRHFTNFLRQSAGTDLWSNNPERSRFTDWTCKPRLTTDGGSIIDRIVSSTGGFIDSEILTADTHLDFVPMTDHRPIIGRLVLKPPNRNLANCVHDTPAPVLNKPRIKFPDSNNKHLFQAYRDQTDVKIREAGLHDLTISDDVSFNTLYSALTKIVNDTAVDIFGRVNRKQRNVHKIITNPVIQQLQGRSRALGGALRFDSDPTSHISHAAKLLFVLYSSEHSLRPLSFPSLRSLLLAKRKITNKSLYRERSSEVYARAKKFDSFRITQALAGGSTKRLVQSAEYIPLPMSINTIDGSGKLLTNPAQVKAETRRYWEKLYARQPVPIMDKPWLVTDSVTQVNDRVAENPFVWPRLASLTDFRALVRRGNARPSPGPDGMEKWCVKTLSDFSLAPVLELHNYMTLNSRFPGDTKDMFLTMFHKRGLRTDLNNWRGLMMSNFIANSPMTWLNYLLTPFIAANSILPDTQVATQQGVQTRDLTSFLAGLLTWANRHKTTVYALKRDQMKGFDYLAPEGFYDAITAYGLPRAIIDIDKAAQTNTKVFIRTAHGITDPICVSGVAKQGGPISPLKSTLTTSLGHRYLDDVASGTTGALTISSSSHERDDPHLPNDKISLPIRMIEATDDSILFARTIPALQNFCLLEERFQYAYGWLTNWRKTSAYVLSPSGSQPDTLSLPSITVKPGVSPLTISFHDVPLIPNELEFLRVKINNPSHRYLEIRDFIDAFTYPKFTGPTPITLIRKITMQSIASRARALLTFQPITDADAFKLDKLVAAKVHAISGFPWAYNTEIATLPVSLHGFEFPSLRRINSSIAVDGLARDLNHHITAYRDMALITLADWTCHINECINPLVEPGLLRDFSRRLHFQTIPAAWIVAQKIMGTMSPPLRLCSTDLSHIAQGEVSISHALKMLKTHANAPPSGSAAYSLRNAGIKLVKQLGVWRSINHRFVFNPYNINDMVFTVNRLTNAVKANVLNVSNALSNSSIQSFFFGPTDLLIPRTQRRVEAEEYIRALSATCKFKPSPSSLTNNNTWASDGSMIPAASSIGDDKSITAAVSGPVSIIMRVAHRNASILQGEQMGLVSALVLAKNQPLIYTDHLNSTLLIKDSQTLINQDRRLRSMNGRSYYRWIIHLVSLKSAVITYTKAHTNDSTLSAVLNREADHFASASQKHIPSIPIAPVPTFYMDPYTFHRDTDGWIESNIRYFVDYFAAKATADSLAHLPKHRMATWLYDLTPPPTWLYLKASSAYTALVQLYARSGQLPTAHGMFNKKATSSSSCRFGCTDTETPHHIFVVCPRFSEFRSSELETLSTSIKKKLNDADIEPAHQLPLVQLAKSLFSDSTTVWPLHSTTFYLGQIPKIGPHLPPLTMTNSLKRSRLIHNVANDLHLSSVRLASRIFGDLQKDIFKRHAALYGKRN